MPHPWAGKRGKRFSFMRGDCMRTLATGVVGRRARFSRLATPCDQRFDGVPQAVSRNSFGSIDSQW